MAIHTIHRCLLVLAALICMLFAAGLSDTPPVHLLVETVSAPPLPDSVRDRNGTVSLSVKDANGAPVAGARVTFLLIRDRFAWLAASRTTDDHGHLIARDLPRGELWILAQAEGRSRASTRLILAGEPREVALVSRPAGHLDVRVSGDDDKPVAGARVELRCGDPLPFLAKTNAKGIASLDRLCPPPYEVVVTADGYDSSKRSSLQPGPLPYRVSLKKLGSILVNVVDPHGAECAGAIGGREPRRLRAVAAVEREVRVVGAVERAPLRDDPPRRDAGRPPAHRLRPGDAAAVAA